jgi:CHAT domain-containing protein
MTEQELVNELLNNKTLDIQMFAEKNHDALTIQVFDLLKEASAQHYRINPKRALEIAERSLEVALLLKKPLCEAKSWWSKGNALVFLDEIKEALESFRKAEAIYRKSQQYIELARMQVGMIPFLIRLGDPEGALQTADTSRSILAQLDGRDDRFRLAVVEAHRGIVFHLQGHFEKALRVYEYAQALFESLGPEFEIDVIMVGVNRALVLNDLDRFDEALEILQRSLLALDAHNAELDVGRVHCNLASLYSKLGHPSKSFEHFDCAEEVYAETAEREMIRIYLHKSSMLLGLNRFDEAFELGKRAWQPLADGGELRDAAFAALILATACWRLGREEEAAQWFGNARRVLLALGIPVWTALVDVSEAPLLYGQGQHEAALELAERSRQVFAAHGATIKEAQAQLVIARCHLNLGHEKEAEVLFQDILGHEKSMTQLSYQCHYGLGQLKAQKGDLDGAYKDYQRAINQIEEARRAIRWDEFRTSFLKDKLGIYQDMVLLCLQRGDQETALEYVEQAKSSALVDLLSNLDVRSKEPADEALQARIETLKREIHYRYAKLGKGEIGRSNYNIPRSDQAEDRIRRELQEREAELGRLWRKLRPSAPGYVSLQESERPSLAEIHTLLDEETILVEYYVTRGRVSAFLVTVDGLEAHVGIASLSEIEIAQREVQNSLAPFTNPRYNINDLRAQFSTLCEISQGHFYQLYTYLIAPLIHRLASYRKWIIAPDDILHYVPFHALHDGEQYILHKHELSYTPSASVLKFCCQRPTVQRDNALVMGFSNDQQLPYVLDEVNAIAPLLPNLIRFVEEEAVGARLHEYGNGCDILHLASHGFLLSDNPLLSYILLADAPLSVDRVYDLELDASLVTLSACKTGLGELRGGDVIGLARGFFYAGAASLLVTLWSVHDASTAALMKTFYRLLREGKTKVAALREAQLELIALEEEHSGERWQLYSHPYYWAPFCLMGADGLVGIAKKSQATREFTAGTKRHPPGLVQKLPSFLRSASEKRTMQEQSILTRHTDIACPRQVWLKTPRIPVVVRLTVDKSPLSAADSQFSLNKAVPVRVRVEAPAFEILNYQEQEVLVPNYTDSPPLVFYLRPLHVGPTNIVFDFFQGGNLVGTVSVPVEIVLREVGEMQEVLTPSALHIDLNAQSPDWTLQISYNRWQQPPSLVFALSHSGSDEVGETFHPVMLQGNPQVQANRLYEQLTDLTQRLDPTTKTVLGWERVLSPQDIDRQLKQFGQNLWRDLIPEKLKAVYAEEREHWRDKALLIVSDEPYIPWELVWPYGREWEDEAPWCISLRLTRWLRRDAQGNGHKAHLPRMHLKALACLSPTDSDLPAAQRERQFLGDLATQCGLSDASPAHPTWSKVMDVLEGGQYDWLHVATHGNFYSESPDTDSAIWLQDTHALTPNAIIGSAIENHIHKQRPGFFFNTCHSGREGWTLNHLGGWANRLISAGAGLFLAPLWTVKDVSALDFARTFYQELQSGTTVAEAVRRARLATRRAGDPTWLAYSVYAHPNARVIFGERES